MRAEADRRSGAKWPASKDLPDSRALIWWLVGGDEFFQLEFFNHSRPSLRRLPIDWRPSDHGWTRFGIVAAHFDQACAALVNHRIAFSPVLGRAGTRRTAFRDPYVGVYVELLESGALSTLETAHPSKMPYPHFAYATASVSDLQSARDLYEKTLGLELAPLELLHAPEHDALWNLQSARREGFLVRCGSAVLEVVNYSEPSGRPRRTDYRCSDQGIVNVALGSREPSVIRDAIARMKGIGSIPPLVIDDGALVAAYITDAERELEFLSVPPHLDGLLGFARAAPFITS